MAAALRHAGAAVLLGALAAACAPHRRSAEPSQPFVAPDLPRINGQIATCAGPHDKSFTLEARETTVDLGLGFRLNAWTYDGQVPGPVLEACEGDTVKITMTNRANTSHGLDSHALSTDMMRFGPVAPGRSLTIGQAVGTPGVFMYHCSGTAIPPVCSRPIRYAHRRTTPPS